MDIGLFKRLSEAPGVPGREERIRQLVLDYTAGWWDETRTDPMGNLICLRKATAKPSGSKVGDGPTQKVMISCHLDEIGFYVRHIEKEGFLRVHNAGGFDTRNLFARRVLVQGKKDLLGVMNPSGRPIHLATDEEKKKTYKVNEFFVDLLLPLKEVKKLVTIGDPVTPVQEFCDLGEAVTGKALDNRAAVFVGLMAVKKLIEASTPCPFDVYWVGSVQEEVGCRGAQAAAGAIQPDIGIALDTTLCCDTPGVGTHETVTKFGEGVGIKVMDGNAISNRGLVDEFLEVARKKKIPHQLEILPLGGTDQGPIQRAMAGCRSITLSIPTRYIHTVTESESKKDLQATIDLLAAWLTK